jgi:hypothetical protein
MLWSIWRSTAPASVSSIKCGAFNRCDNIKTVYYGGTAKDLKNALKDKEGNEKLCPRKKGHAEIHYNCKL